MRSTVVLDNEQMTLSQDEFSPFEHLKNIKENLQNFIDIVSHVTDKSILDVKKTKFTFEEAYTYFETAQKQLIQLSHLLEPNNLSSYIYKNPRFEPRHENNTFYNLIILNYLDVLDCFSVAYKLCTSGNFILFNSEIYKEFIQALAIVLNKLCGCLRFETQNCTVSEENVKPLLSPSSEPSIEDNYMIFIKLLMCIYEWQLSLPIEIPDLESYNPILIGIQSFLNVELIKFKWQTIAAKILNELVISLLDNIGVKISEKHGCSPLVFYDKTADILRTIIYSNLTISFCDYQRQKHDQNSVDEYQLCKKNVKLILTFLNELTDYSKMAITDLIFSIIIECCYPIDQDKATVIWDFVCEQLLKLYDCNVTDLNIVFTLIKICDLPEKDNLNSFKETFSSYLKNLQKMLQKEIPINESNWLMNESLVFLSSINSDLNHSSSIILKWKILKNTFMSIIKLKCNNESREKYFFIFFRRMIFMLEEAACSLTTCESKDDFLLIKVQTEEFLKKIGENINNYNIEGVTNYLEHLLCTRELCTLIPTEKDLIIENLFSKILWFFLSYSTNNWKITDKSSERMANLMIKYILNLAGLEVKLKIRNKLNNHYQNLKDIIKHLLCRSFSELEFSLLSNDFKINELLNYFYRNPSSHKKAIYLVLKFNTSVYKRSYMEIILVIYDALEISSRLNENFTNLMQSNFYCFINMNHSFENINLYDRYKSDFRLPYRDRYLSDYILAENTVQKHFTVGTDTPYETIYMILIDFMWLMRRSQCCSNIQSYYVEKILERLKKLRLNCNETFLQCFKPGCCRIFHDFSNVFHELCLSKNVFLCDMDRFIKPFYYEILSIIKYLFHRTEEVEQSREIIFYYIKISIWLLKRNLSDFLTDPQIYISCKELNPQYFNSKILKDTSLIICINTLLHQFFLFLGLNMSVDENVLPLSANTKVNLLGDSSNNYELLIIESTTFEKKLHQQKCFYIEDVTNVIFSNICKFPEINKCVFWACINKLKLTADFSDINLGLCYWMLYKQSRHSKEDIDGYFREIDTTFCDHIENCLYRENFEILCRIVKKYTTSKNISTHIAALEQGELMGWDLSLLYD